MRSRNQMTFTGLLVVVAVIVYIMFIGMTSPSPQAKKLSVKVQQPEVQVDSSKHNPAADIYRKASIEQLNRQEQLLKKN